MSDQDDRVRAQIKERKEREMGAKAYNKAVTYPETPKEPVSAGKDAGEWLREKAGMSTPEEKRKRGEDPRSERQKAIEKMAGDEPEPAPDPKVGTDKGEIGKKWNETFSK